MTLLDSLIPIYEFSFVVTTRNNFDELAITLNSIRAAAPPCSEVVIVDGSDQPVERARLRVILRDLPFRCERDNKTGVFEAMNVGVRATAGKWIVMITAGDSLLPGAGALLGSLGSSSADAVIFAQEVATPAGKRLYAFYPTSRSVWPHQSVVLKRAVHEQIGLYPSEYRYASDQHLFAEVRKRASCEIRGELLSRFLLGGITSGVSVKMSKELYGLRRKLGDGVMVAIIRGFIFPAMRSWVERVAGFGAISAAARRVIFSYYRHID